MHIHVRVHTFPLSDWVFEAHSEVQNLSWSRSSEQFFKYKLRPMFFAYLLPAQTIIKSTYSSPKEITAMTQNDQEMLGRKIRYPSSFRF